MSWQRWNYIQGQGEAELQRSGLMCWPSQSPDLNPAENLRRDLQTLSIQSDCTGAILCCSLCKAGDTSQQTAPAVKVLGLNTNARHTFNLNTLYNFSSTSQLCAALCWSQIKAQSDAFKFVVVTWAVWRLSRDCMLMKLMNWRSVNKYRHEKKRKGRKTARKTSETWAGGADRAWGRFVL